VPAGGPARGCDDDGLQGLLEWLQTVPEPRRRCGIRHRAAVVLAFTAAAVLAGADSVTAVSEWASDAPAEVLAALGAWRDRCGRLVPPSLCTFRRVLGLLDAQVVAAAFGAWLKSQVMAGLADAAARARPGEFWIPRWSSRCGRPLTHRYCRLSRSSPR
jgi:hypothetical protein